MALIARRNPNVWQRILACALIAFAARKIFMDADITLALGAGTLTGPMAQFAYAGSVVLLVGGLLQIFRSVSGMAVTVFGCVLVMPMVSWHFLPGTWCHLLPPCEEEHPQVVWHADVAWWVGLLLTSFVLQLTRGPRRPGKNQIN